MNPRISFHDFLIGCENCEIEIVCRESKIIRCLFEPHKFILYYLPSSYVISFVCFFFNFSNFFSG